MSPSQLALLTALSSLVHLHYPSSRPTHHHLTYPSPPSLTNKWGDGEGGGEEKEEGGKEKVSPFPLSLSPPVQRVSLSLTTVLPYPPQTLHR
jgi:hypothetical protein